MEGIAKTHHVLRAWDAVMAQVRAEMEHTGCHAAQTVVLLPFVQLIPEARRAWLRTLSAAVGGVAFVPRFETTQTWGRRLGAVASAAQDLRQDAAHDTLVAADLLRRAGLAPAHAGLNGRLMLAAWSLARVAAAEPPQQRLAWGERVGAALVAGMDSPVFALEAALARLALAWAAGSNYPTDTAFEQRPDLLLQITGFQAEGLPLTQVLPVQRMLPLYRAGGHGTLMLHECQDGEDEALCAASCVLAHVQQGHFPVALVAQDRELTRRVRAWLASTGVTLRDETGWTLSTTRAAAAFMSLLRAAPWQASTDAVLDWLKHVPLLDAQTLAHTEAGLRSLGQRHWRAVLRSAPQRGVPGSEVLVLNETVLESLRAPRPLAVWLQDLRSALQYCGQWDGLCTDPAGSALIEALRLDEAAASEFAGWGRALALAELTSWVSQTLEHHSFIPPGSDDAQVVILPLPQLLGQPFAALVFPGCDEQRLSAWPRPAGPWSEAQRALLGLDSRAAQADALRAAWNHALQYPQVDLLWRNSEGGEPLLPSVFVQQLVQSGAAHQGADPRSYRSVPIVPTLRLAARADVLPLSRLSASAYEDLRRCPYRFFALRLLRLQDDEEIDTELGKRDFGVWLHAVLKAFHEMLDAAPTPVLQARTAMINVAAQACSKAMPWPDEDFLAFAASWPRVRDGYLHWFAEHEATGARFAQAERACTRKLEGVTLEGKLDRVDHLPGGGTLVLDFKTEPRSRTAARLEAGYEDTQLAYYAALLPLQPGADLRAAYVQIGEQEGTRLYELAHLQAHRDALLSGLTQDLQRLAHGAPLVALGEGDACEYCAARGLCRKDFWS